MRNKMSVAQLETFNRYVDKQMLSKYFRALIHNAIMEKKLSLGICFGPSKVGCFTDAYSVGM